MGRNPNHIGEHPNIGSRFDDLFKGATLEEIEKRAMERVAEIVKDTAEYDACVNCGEETPYKVTDHVDVRGCYVGGRGQLCYKCWKDIYGS